MELETFKGTVDGVDFELTKKAWNHISPFSSLCIYVELMSKKLNIHLRNIHLDVPVERSIQIDKDYNAYVYLKPRLKIVINDRYTPIHLSKEETKEFFNWISMCMSKKEDRRDSFIEDFLDD